MRSNYTKVYQRATKETLSSGRCASIDCQLIDLGSISFDSYTTVKEYKHKFELLRQYKSINGKTNVKKDMLQVRE